MIEIGCLANFKRPYESEVAFAKKNGFQLMQVWYDVERITKFNTETDRIELIKKYEFPTNIHALLELNAIEEHTPKLIH